MRHKVLVTLALGSAISLDKSETDMPMNLAFIMRGNLVKVGQSKPADSARLGK